MDNPSHWIVEYFAAGPVRVSAILRLPLIGLIAVLVWIWEVDHWLPGLYAVILGVYAVAAVLWLVAVLRGPVPRWADWASTAVDVLVIITLCLVSGGATAALLPVFFLLPIFVAFHDRPVLTAVIGTVTAVGYLAVWIFYSERDDKVGLPNMVYTHFGFLLWLAVATTALCYVLARRSVRVKALQDVRRQLVSEAMQSDERHNREVAEHLHDGRLQTLLAARLELDEVRERSPDPALDMVHAALQEDRKGVALNGHRTTSSGSRTARPHFGSSRPVAAVRDSHRPDRRGRARRCRQAGVAVAAIPAARELLTNVSKHAKATTVRVGLSRRGDRIVLTIADDGTGFDPNVVSQFVADGHIGLGSLLARFDAMGGAMDINSQKAHGTQVTVTSPREPVTSSGELGPRAVKPSSPAQ